MKEKYEYSGRILLDPKMSPEKGRWKDSPRTKLGMRMGIKNG